MEHDYIAQTFRDNIRLGKLFAMTQEGEMLL